MKGFKNAKIYVENQGIITTSLSFCNRKIIDISQHLEIDEGIFISNDCVVLPGFIDQHIHGSAGYDTMDATQTAFKKIAQSIAVEGVTGFLATTMTQSQENIKKVMLEAQIYANNQTVKGAKLLGIHLEGPFINAKKAGAQPINYIVEPNVEQFNKYNILSGNNIKIVTLAPEINGSNDFINQLKQINVIASIGHSNATYEQFLNAVNLGVTQITHTYNAQSPFNHRDVGIVGGGILTDEVYCEIICDLIHVSVPAIKILLKNKPKDKIILISDAMRAKNLGDVQSELGGQTVFVKNGEARLSDGTLAGSVLKINRAIKNLVEKCQVSLTDAVDFATKNPAKNLKLFDEMGSIKQGKLANFAVMNTKTFEIELTIREGEIIYDKNKESKSA